MSKTPEDGNKVLGCVINSVVGGYELLTLTLQTAYGLIGLLAEKFAREKRTHILPPAEADFGERSNK